MLCQISKDMLIQQNDCYTNYHIVTLTIPKRGMCWFNTSYKVLINKPFVGLTNPFLQCVVLLCFEIFHTFMDSKLNTFFCQRDHFGIQALNSEKMYERHVHVIAMLVTHRALQRVMRSSVNLPIQLYHLSWSRKIALELL